MVLKLLDQTSRAVVCLVLPVRSCIHLVGGLRRLQVLLVTILLRILRVCLSVGVIHEISLLHIGVRRHCEILVLLPIDGLWKGRRGGRIVSRISRVSLVLVVELEIQFQSIMVVHGGEKEDISVGSNGRRDRSGFLTGGKESVEAEV